MENINVLFVWPSLTGYMGDCWRELTTCNGICLKIVIDLDNKYYGGGFNADDVMRGLDWSTRLPDNWTPDIVFAVGWRNDLCRQAVMTYCGARTKKVCCLDMPWEWKIRKILARFILYPYLNNFDAAFVNGVVARKYARWLGFVNDRIFAGLIGTDIRRFDCHKGGSGFLYVGRNAPEKGLDVLIRAHKLYKQRGGQWELKIVSDVSPNLIAEYYAQADCFVLPSHWEPWGVVLVEAAAAGLPIICTDKCGARYEVVRDNGLVVKSGNVVALVNAMHQIENMSYSARFTMGMKGILLARSYSCQAWAARVVKICHRLLRQ